MKRLLFALLLVCATATHATRAADADPATTRQVNAFVDAWHDDAAHARMAYFDRIAPDGVYIGTDRTELWHKDAFKTWAAKYFQGKSAWAFKATRRNVYASSDGRIVWFDELLDTRMGPCMASGVLRRAGDSFEIEHYQLSMAVPNEVAKSVTALIAQAAAK